MAIGVAMRRVVLDVSAFQEDVDFTRVKADSPEIVGVIIKATEGQWPGTNPNFDQQYASARAAGLMVGFYCFDHTSVDATLQASLYLGKVADKPAELGHWLDFEANDSGTFPAAVQAHINAWLTAVTAARSELVGIYSAPWAWDPWTGSADFSRYPLWLAGYLPSLPPSPAHWGRPLLWQFTDAYTCYFGQCDASVILDDAWNPSTEDDMTPAQDALQKTMAGAILQLAGKLDALAQTVIHGDPSHYSFDLLHKDMQALLAGNTNPAVLTALADLKVAVAGMPAGSGGDPAAVASAVAAEVKTITWKAS